MVNRQLAKIGAGELTRTAATNPRVHLQRTLAIPLLALLGGAPGLGNDAVKLGVLWCGHGDD
jgi:hypothetical protein